MNDRDRTCEGLREELRAARARLASLESVLETVADTLFVLDRDWRFVYLNRHALAAARAAGGELLGRSLWEAYPELVGTPVEAHYRRAAAELVPVHFETQGLLSGRWLEVHAYPSPEGLVVYSRDATERRRAELALLASEERQRLIAELTADFAFTGTFGPGGLVVDTVTAGFERATGYRLEDLDAIGGWAGLVHPDDRGLIAERFARLLAGERTVDEIRIRTRDGGTRWIRYLVRPVRHLPDGPVTGTLGAVQDVTERRRADEALRDREARLRLLVEQLPAILWAVDTDLRVTSSEGAGLAGLGLRPGELVGRTMQECLGTDDPSDPPLAAHLQALQGRSLHYESDWHGRSYRVSLEPLRDAAGAVTGCIGLSQDVTEHRRAERQLREYARSLLEIQERERRRLACELHDEVGQALTGLRLTLDAASDPSPALREAALDQARQLVRELTAQVRDLSLRLRPSMLDDLGLLPALLWLLDRYTATTGVRVAFRHSGLEARLPPAVETAAYRIVQEGLANAARHAGVTACAVRAEAAAGVLHLEVEDAGRGFDPAAEAGGPSTGLSGMRERAVLLGGHFAVESAPGRGTRLVVDLPTVTTV